MTARDEAIEAAAKAIADRYEHANSFYLPDARVALAAALPVLLNDLADRIEAEADTAFVGDAATVLDAIRLVRAAAEGWAE